MRGHSHGNGDRVFDIPQQGPQGRAFFVKRIIDKNGKILEEHEQNELQVLSSATSYIMCDLLTGVVRRGTGAAIPVWDLRGRRREKPAPPMIMPTPGISALHRR